MLWSHVGGKHNLWGDRGWIEKGFLKTTKCPDSCQSGSVMLAFLSHTQYHFHILGLAGFIRIYTVDIFSGELK